MDQISCLLKQCWIPFNQIWGELDLKYIPELDKNSYLLTQVALDFSFIKIVGTQFSVNQNLNNNDI